MLKYGIAAAVVGIVAVAAIAQLQPPANRYVDPALCATCHAGIAASFAKTGMGRSFYRLQPQTAVEKFGTPYYHAASETWLEMLERGGKYFQRRWQLGFDGRETNVDEKQVDYVIGSGNHNRSYVHKTSHSTLQQLPLSWYSEKGGYWAMSPGYDRPDNMGSLRAVSYPCMFCHNAYPKIPKAAEEVDALPEFLQPLPEGIDCQRCHGPGQKHVESGGKGEIVNPKKLGPERELEVCMQCHLQTSAQSLPHSVQRLDAGPFSYVPGQPMSTFRYTFDRAGGMGDKFEIAHTAYRLRESQCFLKSGGKLTCTTCHDPHKEVTATQYNSVCQTCHTNAHNANEDCVSCHMPKRRTDDVVHVVMTDHLIERRPPAGNLLADKSEDGENLEPPYRGEVVPYYPAAPPALYAALAQIKDGSNLASGLPRLAGLIDRYHPTEAGFYTALGNGYRAAGQLPKALPYFEEAVKRAPKSAIVLRNLGSAQLESGQLQKAAATLRSAIAIAPQDAQAWGLLGQVTGKADLTKAIGLDPEIPDLHSSLATFLMKEGDAPGAEKEIREALRLQPGNAAVQANLASLLAARDATGEARYHFKQSIRLNPRAADVRLNYARMLASLGEAAEAQSEAEAAIAADSKLAGAHELLGSLLGSKNDVDGALRELETAVQLDPKSGTAQFKLGVAFGLKRDLPSAIEHLKLAAQGSDAEAKQSALEMLQRLSARP